MLTESNDHAPHEKGEAAAQIQEGLLTDSPNNDLRESSKAARAGMAAAAKGGQPSSRTNEKMIFLPLRDWKLDFLNKSKLTLSTLPNNANDVVLRIYKNLIYFQANYLTIALVCFVYNFVVTPHLVIIIPFCGALWLYVFYVNKGIVNIGPRTLSKQQSLAGLSLFTVLCLVYTNSILVLFCTTFLFLALITLHSIFYDPRAGEHPGYMCEDYNNNNNSRSSSSSQQTTLITDIIQVGATKIHSMLGVKDEEDAV